MATTSVIVLGSASVLRSTDLTTWTEHATAASQIWTRAAHSPSLGSAEHGRYVAVSTDGTFRAQYSDDGGETWVLASSTPAVVFQDITRCEAAGVFIAVANAGGSNTQRIALSADGDVWVLVTHPACDGLITVLSVPDLSPLTVFAGGTDTSPYVLRSDDGGTTWAFVSGTPGKSNTLTWNGTRLYSTSVGEVATSSSLDGNAWTAAGLFGNGFRSHAVAPDNIGMFLPSSLQACQRTTNPGASDYSPQVIDTRVWSYVTRTEAFGGTFIASTTLGDGDAPLVISEDALAFTFPTVPAGAENVAWRGICVGVMPEPPTTTVPNVTGLTVGAATAAVTAASLVVGSITEQVSTAPIGTIIGQFPVPGTVVAVGSSVLMVVSKGQPGVIPDVLGLPLDEAQIKIREAGFTAGAVTVDTNPNTPLGTVFYQYPLAGSTAIPGASVALTVTSLFEPFEPMATVISQYTTSPTMVRLVTDMDVYIDQRANINAFYNAVWNIDTAVGFGLDIWGRIVGVGRYLRLASDEEIFGFANDDIPANWTPWNDGVFFPGDSASDSYPLPDDAYRTLILTKALSNIVATTAPALNQLLRNLFPNRGKAYVRDLGGMAMQYVFEFALTETEYAILTQSGALPHPAGVAYSVNVIPVDEGLFGFSEAGSDSLPFDVGTFFLPV